MPKGATGQGTASSTATHLHTLNANWSVTTKYAFECVLWVSSGTLNAELWDFTAGSAVSGSQISTTSTTATVIRSGQFTLMPGHVYGITFWASASNITINLTDASIIIFPPAGTTAPNLSCISLVNPSGNTLKEAYIPLWVYSNSSASSGQSAAGSAFIGKGQTNIASPGTSTKLHTLSSSWNPNQKFAFEASVYDANAAGTGYWALWDATSNTIVTASQISTSATTATLIRSGSFTLTPGHAYEIAAWQSGGYAVYLTKAHLVALGS
jgi:hypothetical protein